MTIFSQGPINQSSLLAQTLFTGAFLIIGRGNTVGQSSETNVAAYCGHIANLSDLILADMCSFSQPHRLQGHISQHNKKNNARSLHPLP